MLELQETTLVAGGDEQHLRHGDLALDVDVVERSRRDRAVAGLLARTVGVGSGAVVAPTGFLAGAARTGEVRNSKATTSSSTLRMRSRVLIAASGTGMA